MGGLKSAGLWCLGANVSTGLKEMGSRKMVANNYLSLRVIRVVIKLVILEPPLFLLVL